MRQAQAEEVAIAALGWLAAEEDWIGAFLAQTGAGADDLRAGAGDPAFLGAVLDFVLQSDEAVLGVAAAAGCRPEEVAAARAALPGGDLPHWT